MTHFYMLHSDYGFEMQVFPNPEAAEAHAEHLRTYNAYSNIEMTVIRVEPQGNVVRRLFVSKDES